MLLWIACPFLWVGLNIVLSVCPCPVPYACMYVKALEGLVSSWSAYAGCVLWQVSRPEVPLQ
jgi:hypothetical protein